GIVKNLVRSALGGVLFIDEAYNIVVDQQDMYGKEAISVLMTEMENNKEQFALIAAGYEREMDGFLDANSGLRSRFSPEFRFHFEDYSPGELWQIFENLARHKGRVCGPGVRERVLAEFTAAWKQRGATFGNGRAVRNYFDSALSRV